MVPTVRPSGNTSILAPTRCGVDPFAETIVTSAASSPRSSACVRASNTSWDMWGDYNAGGSKFCVLGAGCWFKVLGSRFEPGTQNPGPAPRTQHPEPRTGVFHTVPLVLFRLETIR